MPSTTQTSIVRKFSALREAKAALFELNGALNLAMKGVERNISSLCGVCEGKPLPPAAIKREDAPAAVRAIYASLLDGPISHYEAERDRLTEELEDECERRGLDFALTKNALLSAEEFKRRVMARIHEAALSNWRNRPNRYSNNTSPLYGLVSDLRFYRKHMQFALRPIASKRAAA